MPPTILFDFDGTLVRGDSGARYLKALIDPSLPRRTLALAGLPLLLPAFSWWRSARAMTSAYLWLATVGRGQDELDTVRRTFIARCAGRQDALLIAPAVQRLAQHLTAGHRVAIVTGSEERLARELWAALGGPEVPLWVGSRFRAGLGGWLPERHCFGPRKLDALAETGIHPPFHAVYTDSARDLPLLRHAEKPVLVSPGRTTLRRVRRELGDIEVI
jgi:phosphatidylglycerophosphatase C